MQICAKCKKEMTCVKTGVVCRWGEVHCYAGDKYKCPQCDSEVIHTSRTPFYSDKEIPSELLIQMD